MTSHPDLLTRSYAYALPPELIASAPAARRDGSRMLVFDRSTGTVEHRRFAELEQFLRPADCVVMNDARVVPARLHSTDGRVEILWQETRADGTWRVLGRPGKKLRPGRMVEVGRCVAEVVGVLDDGDRILRWAGGREPDLEQVGELALPHYFGRGPEEADRERYQTVFARQSGAIAAPTAGLHFTPELVARLDPAWLTLFVGVGTFRPVSAENLAGHRMHEERFELPPATLARLATARQAGGRVVAVGTTVTRVLEHLAATGELRAGAGSTDIFLHLPHRFAAVDALLTNFHLPQSTLLMLVSAFVGSRERTLELYREAVAQRYRFFSYGDCMLIL